MSICDILPSSNIKIAFRMSKRDIPPEFKSQNGISNVKKTLFGPNSNVKIGFRMTKFDIWLKFECHDKISNVKMRYSA